ncbi:MAG: site-specific DNA-methyltransferase [Holosporales bacterium]
MLFAPEKIENIAPSRLNPYKNNPRTHTAEQIAQVAASIQEFGFTNPILADQDNRVIAGHCRLLAAQQQGLDSVPVIRLAHLTPAQRRAYIIADNKLALNAGWDEKLLASEMEALLAENMDLNLTGFSDEELALLLPDDDESEGDNSAEEESLPDLPENPISVPGDIWLLGNHRLMCGDSTNAADVAKLLDGAKPNLMVTDPPYGVEYDPTWREKADKQVGKRARGKVLNDDRADWRDAWALCPGNIAYIWHGALHSHTVVASLEAVGFALRSHIVWAKQHFVFSRGDYHWQHETCWYAVRNKGNWQGDRKQTTLWQIKNNNPFGNQEQESTHGHGTQKPVECMRRPILNNSQKGDSVYEPFSGSGTTIIAAESVERVCYAMELSPAYVDMAVRRWQEFTGGIAIHASTGQPFEGADLPMPAVSPPRPSNTQPPVQRVMNYLRHMFFP